VIRQLAKYSLIILMATFPSWSAFAQLSPGPLTESHSELEGMANCTQCHDIGKKVPDAKCLSCHEEIQSLMTADRGYHASDDVISGECIDCHSEHHGRKFDMVRFDTENFDHDLTGYELLGQHGRIDCRDCHKPDFIADTDIRMRKKTWLGMDTECLACHVDYHQETLGQDCASCHDFEAFRPAPLFDHDETEYTLEGQHTDVECISCHAIETRNGKEFQIFKGLSFGDCVSCHDDPHWNLPGKCRTCHDVNGFEVFMGKSLFNHELTAFSLKDSHSSLDCFECHSQGLEASSIFRDLKGILETDCMSCHDDVHEGKFGLDCARCHNTISFMDLNADIDFDHSLTDYNLEGLHANVECKSCHKSSFTDPIDFSYCRNCHEDYHNGQFVQSDGQIQDCGECHSVYEDFTFTSYGLDDHAQSAFPLEGAHVATPCFACHLDEASEEWNFRHIGQHCVDCHEDIHEGYISDEYYPDRDCLHCHNSDSWATVSFDHDLTDWPLEDKHADLDCSSCHIEEKGELFIQRFNNLNTECYSCHENVHGDQFEEDGVTDCKRCHSTAGWEPENFDHSITRFPLEGKHAELECQACHKTRVNNKTVFKIERFECIDCHS